MTLLAPRFAGALVALLAIGVFAPGPAAAQAPDLQAGEKLEQLSFPAVTMQLKGWTKFGNAPVYTLAVKNGQRLRVTFETRSRFAYLAIFDLAEPDDAIFGTDEDGLVFDKVMKADTTLLLRPYYSKVSPRRGLGAPFSVTIEPNPSGPPPVEKPKSDEDAPSLFPPRGETGGE